MVISRTLFEQCPKCKAQGRDLHKDNLAIFADGHKHCFACGYHLSGNKSIDNMKKKLYQWKPSDPKDLDILEEAVYNIPPEPLTWLKKYNLTNDDILRHNIFWYPPKKLLVFPIYDGDRLVAFSGRYFGDNPEHPKYITKVAKHGFWKFIPKTGSDIIVLTEDVVSAIRVSHNFNAVPLLGTNAPTDLFLRLLPLHLRMVTWLDRDKAKEAMTISSRARQYFPAQTLVTPKDPKYYTNQEIKEFVDVLIPRPTEGISQQGMVC